MKFKSIITLLTLIGLTCISTVSVYALPSDKDLEPQTTADAIVSDIEDIIVNEVSGIQTLGDDVGMGMNSFAASASEIIFQNEA